MRFIPDIFFTSNGEKIDVRFDGLYRATVDGLEFCSSYSHGLVEGIRAFHSVQTNDPKVKPTRTQELISILNNEKLLEKRQAALSELESLSSKDTFARETIDRVKSRRLSIAAKWITMVLNKPDFYRVTVQEICSNVYDPMDKESLITELGNRVKI